jgi:hypothetical protein
MKSHWWPLYQFVYGSDNRVAKWLTVVGGIWLGSLALVSVALLFAADTAQCPDGLFAPPCTESILKEIVGPMVWSLVVHPAFFFLLLGIAGIAIRRRSSRNGVSADLAGPAAREIRLWAPLKALYGPDCRLATWFVILGLPWLIGVLRVVNQAYAQNLPPYTQAWLGSRPQIESFFDDVLMPVISNNWWHPGAWLMLAGLFGAVAWGLSYLWQRRHGN